MNKIFALLLTVVLMGGCQLRQPLIPDEIARAQVPAVKAAATAAKQYVDNMDKFNDEQKRQFAELNARAWEAVAKVYDFEEADNATRTEP